MSNIKPIPLHQQDETGNPLDININVNKVDVLSAEEGSGLFWRVLWKSAGGMKAMSFSCLVTFSHNYPPFILIKIYSQPQD